MNTTMLKRGRAHFYIPGVPRRTARHNVRAWVRSLRMLGEKWLLAQPARRTQ